MVLLSALTVPMPTKLVAEAHPAVVSTWIWRLAGAGSFQAEATHVVKRYVVAAVTVTVCCQT